MSNVSKAERRLLEQLGVRPGDSVRMKEFDPAWVPPIARGLQKDDLKARSREYLQRTVEELAASQGLPYASDVYSVLVVLQAMDAAGKDGTIKHVMSGVNPQGCQVYSFKQPSAEELDHNFLWRYAKALPERGRIGIFNRSLLRRCAVVKVHRAAGAAPRKAWQVVLGAALRRHQRLRAAPGRATAR